MKIFVAITDSDWYSFLSSIGPLDEVNFWQPSASGQFRVLQPGEPFLFKLHSPNDYIVGGGFFAHYSVLPVSLAWKAFGTKNGARTEREMRARVEKYRRVQPSPVEDYNVGCILLESPFYLRREDWIGVPDWSKNIVRGKGFNSVAEPGRSLWTQVQAHLTENLQPVVGLPVAALPESRFGAPQTIFPRLGQGSFRVMVTDAYQRRCAFTRSPVLCVLEAAHIKPFPEGPHAVRNGLLVRADFHELFDRGYVTVTPECRIEVSRKIKEEFENGKEYYSLQGSPILLPDTASLRPSPEYLSWHNENVYQG